MGNLPKDDNERSQAMIMWIVSLFAALIGPLIFFMIANDQPYLKRQSALAITLSLLSAIASIILMCTIVGAILIPLVGIFQLVICVMGIMACSKGEDFNPPLGITTMTMKLFKM